VIDRLPYVAGMGFDVLYLPPIHPIGATFRKGPNNVTTASPADPGVPWAIGSPDGGHEAIHPALGTFDDFAALVAEADRLGLCIALDIAFQASPDHPWVTEHPTWFRQRPDGTVQYAENPPKKYQDIYPFDFESEDWPALWQALADVFRFWVARGVTIFRVDNPHTKAFPFWEWAIGELKREHPDVLFLAEAFTRPKVMYRLAKLGFSQSYTYFTWRNTSWELRSYFEELTRPPVVDFFRPNAWPNTPDILHADLQMGGRPAFQARLVLAAMLSANYGIYGPAYELLEHVPREPGSEEYLDSEKYQLQHWELEDERSIAPLIATVNRLRRLHPALQSNEGLRFHGTDDDHLLAWTKQSPDGADIVLTIVSLDFAQPRSGTLDLSLETLGIPDDAPYEVADLLAGSVERWQGRRQPVAIDPDLLPARILQLRPPARGEGAAGDTG
jgi:starch synthase (maltosyl-transferring)